ncbi:hypothetical protein L596_015706 [Steinernema carpocapsae]|uniref:RNA polymerase Rpb1 domain-containing protein n=1 Tax=Steinernema carpocapsae TaxID=34508 RepID=A0A4U5NFS1_STECR|nr:hypothetical protein L596_015706 [Steinernema carpocapsae]
MVQLRYGEDGLDGMWVENQNMPTMKPSEALFIRDFKLDLTEKRRSSAATRKKPSGRCRAIRRRCVWSRRSGWL